MLNDVATPQGADAGPREINRRTIAKGVAWSVPVIVMATAAPAAAASNDVHLSATAGLGAKSGNDYEIIFTFTSHGVAGTVSITDVTGGASEWSTTSSGSISIAANGTAMVVLLKKKGRDAASQSVNFSYTRTGGATTTGVLAVAIPATPK